MIFETNVRTVSIFKAKPWAMKSKERLFKALIVAYAVVELLHMPQRF